MPNKSKTCFSRNGKALSVYYSEREAKEGAKYANSKHDLDLVPYECSRCGHWHLAPESRQTPSEYCVDCKKELYKTREAAEKRAAIIRSEKGKVLRVYECKHQKGWHLTSSKQ